MIFQRWLTLWLCGGLLITIVSLAGALAWTRYADYSREATAIRLIDSIETYRMKMGRLPKRIEEIGIFGDESGPIYYQRETDSEFSVWYGKALGESRVYSSVTKSWLEGG